VWGYWPVSRGAQVLAEDVNGIENGVCSALRIVL